MLDAHQLNIFLTAAETLSFTQAAKHLHLSQPSVSQHIKSLEDYFDTPLFLRAGRSVELTDAGVTLIPLAQKFVNTSTYIEEAMISLSGEVYGHLTVGCSTSPGKYVLPGLLTRFHTLYPKVTMECQVAPQVQTVESLSRGELNFALASLVDKPNSNIEFYKIMCDPVVLVAPNDHPWAAREEIEIEELLDADFIMREKSSGTYSAVNDALNQTDVHLEQLNVLLTLGNSEAIALAVKEGLGVGFVSQIVEEAVCYNQVSIIKVAGLDICRDIYFGHNTKIPATKAQMAFWDFVTGLETPLIELDAEQ